jgi:flavin reductase (DIM6/NTAB) family NADH-FMN oxidoreductase RutF
MPKKDDGLNMDSFMSDPDSKELRATLGCFPTGVAVVTTASKTGENPCGLTINSFSSVSLNPPLILWSLALESTRLTVFQQAEYFAINILEAEQTELCQHFASTKDDVFANIDWLPSPMGQPLLAGSVAYLECKSWSCYPGGDHLVILGEVLSHQRTDKNPMIFAKGQLTSL